MWTPMSSVSLTLPLHQSVQAALLVVRPWSRLYFSAEQSRGERILRFCIEKTDVYAGGGSNSGRSTEHRSGGIVTHAYFLRKAIDFRR